jgi:2-amino-4-hydroxy-6-hydroxymethyldihydropteridine diphosphokinase
MNHAYLLIGGNLGDRLAFLQKANKLIEQKCGSIAKNSSIFETSAWGLTQQPSFYNQAIEVHTQLTPEILMRTLLSIEELIGRKRSIKMGPRVIDIDILLYNTDIIQTPFVTIPHLHLTERRFALTPLAEIAPNVIHPVTNKTVKQLLAECTDTLDVNKIS